MEYKYKNVKSPTKMWMEVLLQQYHALGYTVDEPPVFDEDKQQYRARVKRKKRG